MPDPDAEKRADAQYERDLEWWNGLSKSQRKNRYHRPQPPVKPIYKTVIENAGHLPTPTFFTAKAFSSLDFHAVLSQFERLSSTVGIDEKLLSVYGLRAKFDKSELEMRGSLVDTTAYRKQTLFQANMLLAKLEEQIEQIAEPVRLFRGPVLDMICRWANTHLPNEYAVVGKTIVESDAYGQVGVLGLPAQFVIPPLDGIETFRRAINIES